MISSLPGRRVNLPNHTKKHYNKSFKLEVIQAYLAGEGSYSEKRGTHYIAKLHFRIQEEAYSPSGRRRIRKPKKIMTS